MTKEEKLREFLQTIPDEILISEANKRVSARRSKESFNVPKILRRCKFCGEFFGGRDMRIHVAKEHPGGTRVHEVKYSPQEIGRPCHYCGKMFGFKALRAHIKKDHFDRYPQWRQELMKEAQRRKEEREGESCTS